MQGKGEMNDIKLNTLRLHYPEGFHVLSDEELSKYNYYNGKPSWAISDPDRHILSCVSWKKANAFAKMLFKSKDVAKSMESKLKELMVQYEYEFKESISRSLDGERADGFKYTYTAQDIAMTGESFSVIREKTYYYIHFYYRQELEEESLSVINGMLDSITWE